MIRLLFTIATMLGCTAVSAHTMSVSHLQVSTYERAPGVQLELDLAVRDLALTLPLDANADDRVTWGELVAVRPQIERMVAAQMRVTSSGRSCRQTPVAFALRRYDGGAYAAMTIDARCPSAGPVSIRYDLFFNRDPEHRALVTLRHAGDVTSAIATPTSPTVTIGKQTAHPFRDFLGEGVHHILVGYDHLAFLISLLLPAVLIRAGKQWQPSTGLRDGLFHIAGIVTAFTVAHSLTLTLSALGWITPASRWVEAAIAASVLLAALNNVRPVVTRRLWLVGFLFGLVHGFGFAGALSELGLPDGARLQALVAFNLGVEGGQLLVVGAVMPLLFAVRQHRGYARVAMPMASLAISVLASWWLVQRVIGDP